MVFVWGVEKYPHLQQDALDEQHWERLVALLEDEEAVEEAFLRGDGLLVEGREEGVEGVGVALHQVYRLQEASEGEGVSPLLWLTPLRFVGVEPTSRCAKRLLCRLKG